jgi:hypothetical protein
MLTGMRASLLLPLALTLGAWATRGTSSPQPAGKRDPLLEALGAGLK